MEYINDISINEAVIHILDSNSGEPVLNEYSLDLDEDKYKFLYKHIDKCLKDDELKYARFNPERNIVKEVVQDYLNGIDNDLIGLSKELASQLFIVMKSNVNIPSGDLIIGSIVTDQGPMIAILKMDYVNNFTHEMQILDKKIGIDLVKQVAGLSSSKKVQKAAFIKPIRENDEFNLMILDKQKNSIKEDEYGANYFINTFLGATLITNERDNTKNFLKASENWIRQNIYDDAEKAEKIRNEFRNEVQEKDVVNIEDIAKRVLTDAGEADNFKVYMAANCEEKFEIDKVYVKKKSKRIRLNIDREIDVYINDETYHDSSKFEVVRNGDGSINMVIKNVVNYIEK